MTYPEDAVKSTFQRLKPFLFVLFASMIIWAIIAEAPPTKITIEAGPRGGFFDSTALMLKEKLKDHNIDATIINSEQTSKIISNVNDPKTRSISALLRTRSNPVNSRM